MSRPSEPVETTSMSSITSPSPRRMIEPLPNCFSICASAACRALAFSVFRALTGASIVSSKKLADFIAEAGCLYSDLEGVLIGVSREPGPPRPKTATPRIRTGFPTTTTPETRCESSSPKTIKSWQTVSCARCATRAMRWTRSAAAARPTPRSRRMNSISSILDLGLPKMHGLESCASCVRAARACRCSSSPRPTASSSA
jgi:hypothetical protein